MRILSCLLNARSPQREPVPFKEILPLKLKPRVSGKGDKTSEVYCLYEMSVLLACFKSNEFNQKVCSKEIEKFQECYNKSVVLKQNRKEKEAKGILVPGEKRLSPKQVNTLLSKFPQY